MLQSDGMSEMTRETVGFSFAQELLEMSVLVAGNVLTMVAKQVRPWAAALK